MRSHRIERVQRVPRSLEDTFAFFADAENLEAITPPFLGFEIRTPRPIPMAAGTLLEYRLRLFGVPFAWLTRIEVFEPNRRFSDVQLRGPYRRWHHLHEFHPVEGGTLVVDCVDYELPFGPIGVLAHALFVRRTLARIFDHRRERIAHLLAADGRDDQSLPSTDSALDADKPGPGSTSSSSTLPSFTIIA